MIDAIQATEEVFFRGYGIIIYSAELGEEISGTPFPAAYDWAEPYRQALELRQAEKVKTIFRKIHNILTPVQGESGHRRLSRSEAFNLCFSVVGITLSVLKKEPEKHWADENLYEAIGIIETLEGLREWMRCFEAKILDFFESLPEKSYEDHIVIAAKRYIAENFRRPISLNSAAKDLAISAGHLSSVFKRRTNTGFVEYVTGVKIDKAKSLLLSGQYKIYEVSELVGYEDNGYFIKTFHKITGMTPKEFIKKHI
jgi:two-component system response regulator YesN